MTHEARPISTGTEVSERHLERSLIDEAYSGSTEAHGKLYARLNPVIHGAMAHVLSGYRGRSTTDLRPLLLDLMQDVWCHLLANDWTVLRGFDASRTDATLDGYVRVVACRFAIARLRIRKNNPTVDPPMEVTDAMELEVCVSRTETVVGVRMTACLLMARLHAELTSQAWQVFYLVFGEELPSPEVAERLGLSVDSVYAYTKRSRALAREILAEINAEEEAP
ncbi:MAG: sigma-70 family RNA polymerase sigma factor [Deltaproteobacteria bacterium]